MTKTHSRLKLKRMNANTPLPPNFILVNKPVGWTSFDVVGFVRKLARTATGQKNIKVGHAGTLDPFATGLLIVGVGREATKRLDEYKNLPKTYLATIYLGATSTTDDPEGEITQTFEFKENEMGRVGPPLALSAIKSVLKKFVGSQQQVPPMFSAKKINGTRLYKLARQGKEVERVPNQIEIYDIKLLDYSWPSLKIEVTVSSGTYIRTLAKDIGTALGVGGYCQALTRIAVGPYLLQNALEPNQIKLI